MLTTAQRKLIADILRVKEDDLDKAIKDEKEVELPLVEGLQSFTGEEITARDENTKKEVKTEYVNEGKEIGKEIATKVIAKKVGIETTLKDPEKVAELVVGKIGGEEAAQEQIKLLQKDVKERDKTIEKLNVEKESAARRAGLLGKLPTNRIDALSTDEQADILDRDLEFTQEGVKNRKTGEIYRDTQTKNPLPEDKAIEAYYTQRNWLKKESDEGMGAGRGGNNSHSSSELKTQKDWRKSWEKRHPDVPWHSMEAQADWQRTIKENPSIIPEDDLVD